MHRGERKPGSAQGELQCCHSLVVAKDACPEERDHALPCSSYWLTNIHSMFTDPLISNMMPSHTQKPDTLWNYLVISYTGRFLQRLLKIIQMAFLMIGLLYFPFRTPFVWRIKLKWGRENPSAGYSCWKQQCYHIDSYICSLQIGASLWPQTQPKPKQACKKSMLLVFAFCKPLHWDLWDHSNVTWAATLLQHGDSPWGIPCTGMNACPWQGGWN